MQIIDWDDFRFVPSIVLYSKRPDSVKYTCTCDLPMIKVTYHLQKLKKSIFFTLDQTEFKHSTECFHKKKILKSLKATELVRKNVFSNKI